MRASMIAATFAAMCALSCTTVLKTAYGIKKPKLETETSAQRYLSRRHIDTTDMLTFKDFEAFASAQQRGMLSIPDAMFFNAHGNLVRYKKEGEGCNAKVDDFLTDLKQFSSLPDDTTITLNDLSSLVNRDLASQRPEVTVVVTWTIYAGRLNKTKAFEWVKLVDKAKANGIDVRAYLLNCDFQKAWNLPPIALEKLGIKN